MRKVSNMFWRSSPNLFFLSIVLSGASGILYSLLIPFITYALSINAGTSARGNGESFSFFSSPTEKVAVFFLVSCVLIILVRAVSGILSMYVTNKASLELRLDVYERIRRLSTPEVERIGQSRLLNIVNIDIPTVSGAALMWPTIWVNLITVLGSLGYLLYLNKKVFLVILGCILAAVLSYQLPMIAATNLLRKARDKNDEVQQGFKGLVFGLKQLKLDRAFADDYLKVELRNPEFAAFKHNLNGSGVLFLAQSYGDLISFLIVGVVIFHFRYTLGIDREELFGIVMALLYLAGPVGSILNCTNMVRHGKVSSQKLAEFYSGLPNDLEEGAVPLPDAWDTIHLSGLGYAYPEGEFSIGGIDLRLKKGEITFIIGGNGSGKSTLGRCLSLHYPLSHGSIRFGNSLISSANAQSAREKIAIVFPDFYLFKRLPSSLSSEQVANVEFYLRELKLGHKVQLVDGEFSTVDLSDGQRKRLALVSVLSNDREIYIFDEWAADQDPEFKEVFYSSILHDLKRRGKVVVVISHDDRYFKHGDQVVHMAEGKIFSIKRNDRDPASEQFADQIDGIFD